MLKNTVCDGTIFLADIYYSKRNNKYICWPCSCRIYTPSDYRTTDHVRVTSSAQILSPGAVNNLHCSSLSNRGRKIHMPSVYSTSHQPFIGA